MESLKDIASKSGSRASSLREMRTSLRSVVADEIGNLASETSSTVSNINGITTEANQAVQNMEACLQETLRFLDETVLRDYSDFMGVAEKYTEDASNFEENMKAIGEEVE